MEPYVLLSVNTQEGGKNHYQVVGLIISMKLFKKAKGVAFKHSSLSKVQRSSSPPLVSI